MNKRHWKGFFVLMVSIILIGYGLFVTKFDHLGFYNKNIDALLYLSLALFVISPLLFFVGNKTFFRWGVFAILWLSLSAIFVTLSPEYQGGWMGIGPEKESVSILMGSLFVIISLPLLLISEWKVRQKIKS